MTTTNHGAPLPAEPQVIDLMQALKVSLADTALEDIGRFAREADESERAAASYAQRPDDAFNSAEYRRLCDAASVAKHVLASACSSERILSLVAMARQGAEDAAELQAIDGLLARRSAFDNIPARYSKIAHALNVLRGLNAPANLDDASAARPASRAQEGR